MGPDRQSTASLIGTVLEGAYQIEGLIGEGGMGAVYEASQLRLGKRVAVKVMARELAANPEALARFHREAVITSGLGHPHIVQVFDFSTTPTGEPFLVMEYLEGEDLEHRIRRVGGLPPLSAIHIIKQVASALSATHAKTIVHRDLKPANIYLLEASGETDFVKVLDFGISKVRAGTTKLTRSAAVMGTPNYMSPEQALGRIDEIDERTDQWALACIAWECLSGEGPFLGENVPSILFQVVHEPPPALVPKFAGLSPRVEETLRRALAKNKNDRFPTVNDFATSLEAAIVGNASPAAGVPGTLAQTMRLPNTVPSAGLAAPTTFTQNAGELADPLDEVPSRPRWFWAAAASTTMLLLVGALLLFRPWSAPKPVVASPPPAVPAPASGAATPSPVNNAAPLLPPRTVHQDKEDLPTSEARPRPALGPSVPKAGQLEGKQNHASDGLPSEKSKTLAGKKAKPSRRVVVPRTNETEDSRELLNRPLKAHPSTEQPKKESEDKCRVD